MHHIKNFRLDLLEMANYQMIITKLAEEENKNILPNYIPNPSSINYILTYCLDIRRSPGRVNIFFIAFNKFVAFY